MLWYSSVQFSLSVVSDSLRPHVPHAHRTQALRRGYGLQRHRQGDLRTMSDSLQPHGLQHARPRLLKLKSIELVMPSNHLILCHPLLLLPSIFSSIRVFSNESVLRIRWPKYWSFSFSISPSNEYSGLISLRWTGWISLQSEGFQESSPIPQFKSINPLVLSFLYSPTHIHT